MAITNPEKFAQKQHLASSAEKLYARIRKYGVTPFASIEIKYISRTEASTSELNSNDRVIYCSNGNDSAVGQFLLERDNGSSKTYYVSWPMETEDATGTVAKDDARLRKNFYDLSSSPKPWNNRLFVSPNGYIYNGEISNISGGTGSGTSVLTFDGLLTDKDIHIEKDGLDTLIAGDTILYGNDGNGNLLFILKGRRPSAGGGEVVMYWDSWGDNNGVRQSDNYNSGKKARTDRFYASTVGYVVEGEFVDITSRFSKIEEEIGYTSGSHTKLVVRVENVENALNPNKDGSFAKTTNTAIQNINDKLDPNKEGSFAKTTNAAIQQNTKDINTEKERINGIIRDYATKTLVKNSVQKYGVHRFHSLIDFDPTSEAESGQGQWKGLAFDEIVLYAEDGVAQKFFFRTKASARDAYRYWTKFTELKADDSGEFEDKYYNNTDGNAFNDRFFASPAGYVVNGVLFDISAFEEDIHAWVEIQKYAKQTDLTAAVGRIETIENDYLTSADKSALVDAIIAHGFTFFHDFINKDVSPEAGDALFVSGDKIVFNKKSGQFLLERKTGTAPFERIVYYSKFTDSAKYNDPQTGIGYVDRPYVSEVGFVINGSPYFELSLIETAFHTWVEGKNYLTQADKTTLEGLISALAGRMTTAEGKITTVEKKQSDLEKQYKEQTEVWAETINDHDSRIGGLTTRVNELESTSLKRVFLHSISELPTNPADNTIYMVLVSDNVDKEETPATGDYYDEYIWNPKDARYERIGSSRVSMAQYTHQAEANHYRASNAGIRVNSHPSSIPERGLAENEFYCNVPAGTKFKVVNESSNIGENDTFFLYLDDQPYKDGFSFDLQFDKVYSLSGVSASKVKISYNPAPIGDLAKPVRFFLLDTDDSIPVMTEDDVTEIFANLV